MPDWQLDIQNKQGTSTVASDVPFHALRATKSIDGPGSMEVTLRDPHINDDWFPGNHRLVLSGPFDFAGFLTNLTQSGRDSEGGITWTASALGLAYVLDWRLIRQQISFIDQEASDIVFDILDHLQDQYNGDMNFSHGAVNGTCDTITEEYCFGVIAGDAIRDLSQQGDNGFDWEINETGALHIWAGNRGTVTGLDLHPNDVTNLEIAFDTTNLVTTVSAVGSPADPFGPIHDVVRDFNAQPFWGRREIVIDVDADEDQRPRLIRAAKQELKAQRGATLTVVATWHHNPDGPWNFPAVGLQDKVDVHLDDWFGGTQQMRCTDFSLELDPAAPDDYFIEYGLAAQVTDSEIDQTDA
jgi:hypothetical protein